MTVDSWSLVRFLHVTAAMFFVGGQLMLSGIVLPALRSRLTPEERLPILHATARRFGLITNAVLLPILLITGLALVSHRGVTWETLGRPGYGRLLSIKLSLVVLTVILGAVHGMLAGRRPRSARPLAIGGLGASLTIVVFATALVP